MLSMILIVSFALLLIATFVLASYILFFQHRRLNLAETRQRLFEVRDKLFDLGAHHVIPFDAEAHDRLRIMINCSIRYAHDLSVMRLLLGLLLRPKRAKPTSSEEFEANLLKGLEGKSLDAAREILAETHYWLMVHCIKGSVLLALSSLFRFLLHLVFGKRFPDDLTLAE